MKYSHPSTTPMLGYQVYTGKIPDLEFDKRTVINTINPHSYIEAKKDNIFREALMSSSTLLPDGIGIVIAAKILSNHRLNKIAGSDIHINILKQLNDINGRCFYLGASENTLTKIKEKVAFKYPDIKVDFYSPPFRAQFTYEENKEMIDRINNFSPDVLFVGMTAPKQEKWVYEHRHLLNASCICSIGAVFDFYAGTKKRPSKFWIKIGLEFLPRFLKEPQRLWRRNFISTPLFIKDVIIAKLNSK